MSRFKTELCNNLIELGTCKYGDRCHYAHGNHELRQVSKRHPKYRTEKCKNFELTGKCPFGPRCSYVHPKPDLDSMIEQLTKYLKHTRAPKPEDSEDDFEARNVHHAHADMNVDEDSDIYYPSKIATPDFTRTNSSVSISCDSMITNSNGCTTDDDYNKENQLNILDSTKLAPGTIRGSNSSCSLTSGNSLTTQLNSNRNGCKKLRLISNTSSNMNNLSTSNNPFSINNPLSDFLNISKINGSRGQLTPNKQLYTRF